MDEPKSDTTSTPENVIQPTGQVMDVTAPQSVIEPTPSVSENIAVTTPASEETPSISPEPVLASEPAPAASFAEAPANPVATESSADTSSAGLTASSNTEPVHEPPATDTTQPNAEAPKAAKPHVPHTGAPVAAIAIAVVVAIALAGVVIYGYMQTKNSDTIKRSDASSSQTVTEKPQASVADVDTTDKEIDSSLAGADDAVDFASTDLDDSTLGL